MKSTQLILLLATLLGICLSSTNYDNHGSDWTGGCAQGQKQSPINIETYLLSDEPTCLNASFNFTGKFNPHTVQKGHTLQTELDGNAPFFEITFPDEYGVKSTYRAIQFHFHSKSEHTVDGEHFDLEVHIVTQNIVKVPKKLAVFGIFLQETEEEYQESPLFQQYKFVQDETVGAKSTAFELDFSSMFNLVFRNQNKLFTYQGSLTTPTCDEIVNWHVIKKPIKISSKHLELFQEQWFNPTGEIKDGNNRVTLPLNGRQVKYVKFCSSVIIGFSFSLLYLLIQLFM